MAGLDRVNIKHIPRTQNKLADQLAILARAVNFASRNSSRVTKDSLLEVLKNMESGAEKLKQKLDQDFWSVDGVTGLMGTSKRSVGILRVKLINYLETGNAEEGTRTRPFEL